MTVLCDLAKVTQPPCSLLIPSTKEITFPNEAWRIHRSRQSLLVPEEWLPLHWEGCWGYPALRPPCPEAGLGDWLQTGQEHFCSFTNCASPSCPRLSSRTCSHPDASRSSSPVLPPLPYHPSWTHPLRMEVLAPNWVITIEFLHYILIYPKDGFGFCPEKEVSGQSLPLWHWGGAAGSGSVSHML